MGPIYLKLDQGYDLHSNSRINEMAINFASKLCELIRRVGKINGLIKFDSFTSGFRVFVASLQKFVHIASI